METITRNISEISDSDRLALEHVVGHVLGKNQKVVIQVLPAPASEDQKGPIASNIGSLPFWCNVYDGLTDAEIESLEESILSRADLSRRTD